MAEPVSGGPDADGQPAAAAPPRVVPPGARAPKARGCGIVGLGVLGGAILGAIVGAVAGFGIGFGGLALQPPQNRAREMGVFVGFIVMPFFGLVGAILGGILLGRRAAGRAPGGIERVTMIASAVLAALAVLGIANM
jgi:hypothetical protein